jgi:hypothetical protein
LCIMISVELLQMLHPSNPTMTADGRIASVFVVAEVLKDCKAKYGLSGALVSEAANMASGASSDSAMAFMAPWVPAIEEIVCNAARNQTSSVIDQLQRVSFGIFHEIYCFVE